MNERIQKLIDSLNIKKAEFAKRLNLSQPFVSELCSGIKSPSDRTIADICREFNVSERWLRTGEGDMFVQLSRDEEIAAFMGDILKGEDDNFKRRFIAMLSRLDENDWELLEKMIDIIKKD
jgi:transcriptional regulator with XRE-family HTH domain